MSVRSKFIATIGATALFACSVLGGTAATQDTASVTINANTTNPLTVSIIGGTLDPKTYSFAEQSTAGSITLGVTDERGTQGGWTVSLTATDFFNGDESRSIPVSGLSLDPGSPGLVAGSVGTAPVAHTAPTITPNATGEQMIWGSPSGEGDGDFSLPVGATLIIPGGTLVDTYTSTIMVTINGTAP